MKIKYESPFAVTIKVHPIKVMCLSPSLCEGTESYESDDYEWEW